MELRPEPGFADFHTDEYVLVRWCPILADSSTGDFALTENDEVRLYNTSGSLFVVNSLWNSEIPPKPQVVSKKSLPIVKHRHIKGSSAVTDSGTFTTLDFYEAQVFLPIPACSGSYTICLYDYETRCRKVTLPYRIVPDDITTQPKVSIKVASSNAIQIGESTASDTKLCIPPFGRVEIELPTFIGNSKFSGFVGIFVDQFTDNGGLGEKNEHIFMAPWVVSVFPCPLPKSVLAPAKEGRYIIRYLEFRRHSSTIPMSVFKSPVFEVKENGEYFREYNPLALPQGTIKIHSDYVLLGGVLDVSWNFEYNAEAGPYLNEMDMFLFHIYGHTEAIINLSSSNEMLRNTITCPSYEGTMHNILAPTSAGLYEIVYYSTKYQTILFHGPAVQVVDITAEIEIEVDGVHAGIQSAKKMPVKVIAVPNKPFRLHWSCNGYNACDRYRIYTDDLSFFGSKCLCSSRISTSQELLVGSDTTYESPYAYVHGEIEIVIDRPGYFMAVYWSSVLNKEIAHSKPFEVKGISHMADLKVQFQCPKYIPFYVTPAQLQSSSFPAKPGTLTGPAESSDETELSNQTEKDTLMTIIAGPEVRVPFTVSGEDVRPQSSRDHDTIVLYQANDKDYECTRFFDDLARSHRAALGVFPTYGKANGTIVTKVPLLIQDVSTPTGLNDEGLPTYRLRYHFRYMTDVEGFVHQSTIWRCGFEVNVIVTTDVSKCIEATVVDGSMIADKLKALSQQTVFEDMTLLRATKRKPTSMFSLLDSKGAADYNLTRNSDLKAYFSEHSATCRGHVTFPWSMHGPAMLRLPLKSKTMKVAYEVMSGQVLPSDLLILLSQERGDTIFASTDVAGGVSPDLDVESPSKGRTGRGDLHSGEVILRCPESPGVYIVGYFSSKFGCLVMVSADLTVLFEEMPAPPQTATSDSPTSAQASNAEALPLVPASSFNIVPSSLPTRCPVRIVLCGITYKMYPFALRGPGNDIQELANLWVQKFGVPPDQIVMLTDDPSVTVPNDVLNGGGETPGGPRSLPTCLNIRKALQWLTEGASAGDKIIFYYGGMASTVAKPYDQVRTTSNSQEQAKEDQTFREIHAQRCIVPLDNDWGERCITYRELWQTLYIPTAGKKVQVMAILDCGLNCNMYDAIAHKRWIDPLDTSPQQIALSKLHTKLHSLRSKAGIPDVDFRGRAILPPAFMFPTYAPANTLNPLPLLKSTGARTVLPAFSCAQCWESLFEPLCEHCSNDLEKASSVASVGELWGLIQACRDNQFCCDAFVPSSPSRTTVHSTSGKFYGVFSNALVEALKLSQEILTIGDLMVNSTKVLFASNYDQNPQLFVSHRSLLSKKLL